VRDCLHCITSTYTSNDAAADLHDRGPSAKIYPKVM
jgi:hypothetical protein